MHVFAKQDNIMLIIVVFAREVVLVEVMIIVLANVLVVFVELAVLVLASRITARSLKCF